MCCSSGERKQAELSQRRMGTRVAPVATAGTAPRASAPPAAHVLDSNAPLDPNLDIEAIYELHAGPGVQPKRRPRTFAKKRKWRFHRGEHRLIATPLFMFAIVAVLIW